MMPSGWALLPTLEAKRELIAHEERGVTLGGRDRATRPSA
jgi:hypothetical protein